MWGRMPLIRVKEGVMKELREYAESRGVTLGTAVGLLLEESRDRRVLVEILKTLCRIEEILRDLSTRVYLDPNTRYFESEEEKVLVEEELPSFARENPWIEVLRNVQRKE